jgi:hypothetical protein
MSTASKTLMRELMRNIESSTLEVVNAITAGEGQSTLLKQPDIETLQNALITPEQLNAFRATLREVGISTIFHFLCIIDGVSYTEEELPDLALVSRDTKENICEQFLHDEFGETVWG